MHRNITDIDTGGKPVAPVATVTMRVARPANVPPEFEVHVRRLNERVRAMALDLADGDISRIVIGDDGSVTVINPSRRPG